MNITRVESSTLATIAYDQARELLRLEFRSQAIYQYLGVPAIVHHALLHQPPKAATSIEPFEDASPTSGSPMSPLPPFRPSAGVRR
jgi:hypothetical protein